MKKTVNKGPLLDKIIVLSGNLLIQKEYLKILLINLGAKVISAISNKTNLVHGDILEDGRKYKEGKKYKLAKETKIQIFSDEQFEKYMEKLLKKKWKMEDEAKKYNLI